MDNVRFLNGFAQPRYVDIANEARVDDYFARNLLQNVGIEHQKVFCYSKVVNIMYLENAIKASKSPLVQYLQPWHNCIAFEGSIIVYIWDTRQIVATEKNNLLAELINKADFAACATDAYDAFNDKPMLVGQGENQQNVLTLAKNWVQPWLKVSYYKTDKYSASVDRIEYDITTVAPRFGEILIGNYVVLDYGSRQKSNLEIDLRLSRDAWPKLKATAKQFFSQKSDKLMSFADIQLALLNGLTC